jgi:hypothetical protein
VGDEEMYRVIAAMVGARIRGYEISPQRALGDLRGTPLVDTKRQQKANGSAECVIAAIAAHERLSRYASVTREWDFASPREVEMPVSVLRKLGGTWEERERNMESMRSLARRSAREAV